MQETAAPSSNGKDLVTSLADRVKGSAKVDVAYGEAREVGETTIIPVAAVAYLVGGGGGGGTDASGQGGEGSGAGGGVRVQPVGVLEVTAEETRLVPVIDWTRVITTAIGFFGVWMIVRALRGRRRK
jgi:uncharacterized spore protein YtfJ